MWTCYNNDDIFFHLPPASSHLHSLQVGNCDSNSRLVVDGDDNGKFRLERVKTLLKTYILVINDNNRLSLSQLGDVS